MYFLQKVEGKIVWVIYMQIAWYKFGSIVSLISTKNSTQSWHSQCLEVDSFSAI